MLNDNLISLRQYEFEYLLKDLNLDLFENILEIGPGDIPVTLFKEIKSYIGVEKTLENKKNNIHLLDNIDDLLNFDIRFVIALNSIYFIRDLDQFYLNFTKLNPKYFIYILPTPTWRLWTSLSAYVAFFIKKNNEKEGGSKKNYLVDMLFLKRHGVRGNRFNEFLYYRKKYWVSKFCDIHNGYSIHTKKINIFYTGFNLLGKKLPIRYRKTISKFLGASSRIYVLSRSY